MSGLRILVLGDGPNELDREWGELTASGRLPPLPQLIHRLLGEPGGLRYEARLFRRVEHARGKGHAPEKKTKAAIFMAKQMGYHALAIVRDKDRQDLAVKLTPIAKLRGQMAGDLSNPPCAVGCAIETFDAWMIADGKAIGKAGGDAGRSHPAPENLKGEENTGKHPKDRAREVFAPGSLTAAYAVVAQHVDLDLLEKLCPQGFAPFAEEVHQRIGPVVGRAAPDAGAAAG